MITIGEILKGQKYPLGYEENLQDLYRKINLVRAKYNKPMIVTAGYRTVEHELKMGRSGKSDHCKCKAIDIYDPNKELANWVLNNQEFIASIPLWIEDLAYTRNWVHFTTQPKSKLFFKP